MFTNIEEQGLKEAGFKDDEILELNSIKDALENTESDLEKALSIALTGLMYFVGGPVDVKVDNITLNDTLGGCKITAKSEKGIHAPVALVTIKEENDEMRPVNILYGIQIGTEETVDVLESCKFDGNTDLFAPHCLTYLKLSGYSFLTENGEVSRSDLMVGDTVTGIIQRPVGGDIDALNFIRVKTVSEGMEISKEAK